MTKNGLLLVLPSMRTDEAASAEEPVECSIIPPYTGMMLPVLTESTGDWYADEPSAQTVIDNNTRNCVGYSDLTAANYDAFTWSATDGGSSLAISGSATDGFSGDPNVMGFYASLDLEAGETISVAWAYTGSASGPGSENQGFSKITIYGSDGVLIETVNHDIAAGATSDSGTLVSSTLPSTGRYIVLFVIKPAFVALPNTVDYTVNYTATSSGTLSVNKIQALYDTGGASPSCLACVP